MASIWRVATTFGLSARPTEIGFSRYSTLLLPKWMTRLADRRRSGEVMAGIPGDAVLPMALVDYSAIDSGLGGAAAGCRSPACEGRVSPLYQGYLLLLIRQCLYSQQANLNQMNRHEAPSPASPLIRRFGRPDRRQQPPVRRRQEAAGKYLI
jgi:hypothetical protein